MRHCSLIALLIGFVLVIAPIVETGQSHLSPCVSVEQGLVGQEKDPVC